MAEGGAPRAGPPPPAEPLAVQRQQAPEATPRGAVPPLPHFREPPGLAPPDSLLQPPAAAAVAGFFAGKQRGELLLREREPARRLDSEAEAGTSADEPLSDPELDGWGGATLTSLRHGPLSVAVEDEEEMSSHSPGSYNVSAEIRSRLWAQSLLRLKRSIDEIYCLCEFESDEVLCEQVRVILETGSKDMEALMGRLAAQQQYALGSGGYPFKSGVAWTTRTPKARGGASALEQLEAAQTGTPNSLKSDRDEADHLRILGADAEGAAWQGHSPGAASAGASSPGVAPRRGGGQVPGALPEDAPAWPAPPAQGHGNLLRAAAAAAPAGAYGGSPPRGAALEPSPGGPPGLAPSTGIPWIDDAPDVPPPSPPPGLEEVEVEREEHLHFVVQTALHKVHSRLSRPGRPSPEELRRRCDDRQRRAQEKRASQDDRRMVQLQQAERRMLAARERRQEQEERKRRELLEKMTRARRQYQDQLRMICDKARRENQKTAEVAYCAREAAKSEQETLRRKHENALVSRAAQREQMRQKQMDSAVRLANASERRRKQLETWQERLQQEIEEKERLASQRRSERIHSIKVKSQDQESRSEQALSKRREQQKQDERDSQSFLLFRAKNIGRLALNCDGLPDAIREEVVELGQALAPSAQGGARRGRQRDAVPARARTPPPAPVQSPRSSPPSAEPPAAAPTSPGERQLPQMPEFPLSGAAGAGRDAPGDSSPDAGRSSHRPSAKARALLALRHGAAAGAAEGGRRWPGSKGSSGHAAATAAAAAGSEASAATAEEAPSPPEAPPDGAALTVQAAPEGAAGPTSPPARRTPRARRAGRPAGEEDDRAAAERLRAWRRRLDEAALADDRALGAAQEMCRDERRADAAAAHHARISKLAADLGKALGATGTRPNGEVAEAPPSRPGLQSLDLERADAALAELCRALEQAEQEGLDFSFVLQLDCTKPVIDMCLGIKDSVSEISSAGGRDVPPKFRQLSNLLLSALKWLGLLCKQRVPRAFLLLSGRVAALADVATACLDAHLGSAAGGQLPEASSPTVLFLPQALHVLALSAGEASSCGAGAVQPLLAPYLAACGLPRKIWELFRLAELRGTRSFEGPSPVPLLLLRSMTYLETVVSLLRPPAEQEDADGCSAHVLKELRCTELFGLPSVLMSFLLSAGARDKAMRLPQTVVSLAVQAVRILNQIARFDLSTLQDALGAHSRPELYHLLVFIFEYCNARLHGVRAAQPPHPDERDLLHETLTLLGFYCLQRPNNQGIMCFGAGQTLLALITSLPLHYFMDEPGRCVLFPTILAACFRSERNLELLQNEMNLCLLEDFLSSALAEPAAEGRPLGPGARALAERFPRALWQEAATFFCDSCAAF